MTTTTTTSAVAAPIAMIFSFNDALVPQALDGLTDAEVWTRPNDRNNGMLRIAGHVVQTRAMMLRLLGDPIDTGWGQAFDRGATVGEAERYPSRADIERVMRDVIPRLRARLASLTDDHLVRPATIQIPGTKTLADELAFFALHDSYDVGQMAYLRKALGYAGIAG